jgi:hypothetical protein
MKTILLVLLGVICGLAIAMIPAVSTHLHLLKSAMHGAPALTNAPRVHREEKFSFTAHAPIDHVVPLFGADRERVWAPKWNPQFVHPTPARDLPGMVFTVAHHSLQAVWVNTDFDLAHGRVQYVYVIPEIMVTVITLKLQPDGNQTHVEVEYDRTALSAGADARVTEMASHDRTSGPEWEDQINQYLK